MAELPLYFLINSLFLVFFPDQSLFLSLVAENKDPFILVAVVGASMLFHHCRHSARLYVDPLGGGVVPKLIRGTVFRLQEVLL